MGQQMRIQILIVGFKRLKIKDSDLLETSLTLSDIQNQPILQIFGKLSFTSWKKGAKYQRFTWAITHSM